MKFNRTIWLAAAAISPVIAAQGFAQNAPVQENAPAQIVTPPTTVPPTTVPDKQPVPEAPLNKPVTVPPVAQKKPVAKKSAATDSLKPGEFVWESRATKESQTKIVIVLDIQRLYVFQNGSLVAFSTVSTGKKGHATPPGIFTILEKNKVHKSNLYNDAPMPFMQRLTWDGIALHAGHNPGRPASHGCIRLPLSFAKNLFDVTKFGQQVIVMKDLDTPPPAPPAPPVIVKPVEPPVVPPAAPPVVPEPTPRPAPVTR